MTKKKLDSIITDPVEPWEQLENEGSIAFEAFCVYRDIGTERSLIEVQKVLHKSVTLFGRWSTKYKWVRRSKAYDIRMERIAMKVRDKGIVDMLERHTKVSLLFQNKVIEGLQKLKGDSLSPGDLIRIFETSVKVERLSRGVPDVSDEVRLNQAQEKLDMERAKADMQGKDLAESSGFIEGIDKIGKSLWVEEKKVSE